MLIFHPALSSTAFRRFASLGLASIVLARVADGQSSRPPAFWEGLPPASLRVGFKSFWRRDWSRAWTGVLDAKGRQRTTAARPVRINLWYPGAPSDALAMHFRDYIGSASTP